MSHPLDRAAWSDEGRWSAELGGIRLLFGDGALAELGALARQLGGRRALLVTDPGIAAAGHAERARRALGEGEVTAALFDGVAENPTTRHVEAGVEAARDHRADLLVAVGGGSAMDCAKGINFLLTNGGRMEDYWGADKARQPMLPSIGVPTTAGTGSEAQSYALISQPESHRKMACGDPKARFRSVVLDPELTATLPRRVAAVAAVDAVSHAVESYVTRLRNPISRLFAREAWRLLAGNFEAFLDDREAAAPRRAMLLGAHLAGAAIETSMLGAAHAAANPLTMRYGVPHGVAVGLMLPHVVGYNAAAVGPLYQELAATAGLDGGAQPAERLARRLGELRTVAELPHRLCDCGVEERRLDELARDAAEEWTGRFNPRPVAAEDFLRLYEAAY